MSDRMFCVVCGGSIEIPSVRPRSDTWSHTDSSRCVAVLRAQRESLQGEVEAWTKRALLTEEAERWREAVADGLGYLNRPEGQGGYDVADPQTIVAAFRSSARDLAALRAAGTAVVEAYADCRARGSFAGFWTHVDDLSKALALEPCPVCDGPLPESDARPGLYPGPSPATGEIHTSPDCNSLPPHVVCWEDASGMTRYERRPTQGDHLDCYRPWPPLGDPRPLRDCRGDGHHLCRDCARREADR